MNVDAMRLSSFYHKTAEGKLVAGPIWDFDRSLDSTDGRDNNPRTWYGSGDSTRYFNDSDRVMSWWPDMFDDADFVQGYIDRWTELRQNELSLENVYATIDAHAQKFQMRLPAIIVVGLAPATAPLREKFDISKTGSKIESIGSTPNGWTHLNTVKPIPSFRLALKCR